MLDAIMQLAANNTMKQFESLDKITHNIANFNTSGYKAVRFEQYVNGYNEMSGATREDYSQGQLMVTNRELDLGINGPGFLSVTQPDGTTAFTRDGSLALNSKGYLVTQRGDMVGNGIQVPSDYQKIFVDKQGNVKVQTTLHSDPTIIGKIDLVKFMNPEGLQHIDNNKVVATDASGDAQSDDESIIRQGTLEHSNVSVFSQVENVLRLNASVISNLRVIKFSDDIYRQAVNLRQ